MRLIAVPALAERRRRVVRSAWPPAQAVVWRSRISFRRRWRRADLRRPVIGPPAKYSHGEACTAAG